MVPSLSVRKLVFFFIFFVSLVIFYVTLVHMSEDNDSREQKLQNQKIVLLFWSRLWGRPARIFEKVWEKGNERGQCPVACEVTINRSRIDEAKAFIVHAMDAYPLPPAKHVPWILHILENPILAPVLAKASYMSQFHLLNSYRLDSDFPTNFFRKPSLQPPIPFENKTGGIMAVFSNCEEVRTAYVQELMKYIEVDSYGACANNKEGLSKRYKGNFKELKEKLGRSYKFMLVFFNQDCDYFVDDQIRHALNAGAVPVVMATDKIYEFLPGNLKNSIVNVRNFKSPKDLADRLKFLMNNEKEYNKFLEWKLKGLGNISDTVIGKYWDKDFHPWCQICEAVSQGNLHKEGLKADICKRRERKDWGI